MSGRIKMSNKVFCGGLPWAAGDSDLSTALSVFGEVVDAKVITDRETGRSRGFGFVTFASAESAEQAVRVQGVELGGRAIRIDSANDRGGGGGGGGGGAPRQHNGGGAPRPSGGDGGRPRFDDDRGRGGERRRGRDRF